MRAQESGITGILKVIKNKEKSNITYSVSMNDDRSYRSTNITGKLIYLEGYITKDGKSYDRELVEIDCATTMLIFNKVQGEAIVEKCDEIFRNRELVNDLNPAIDIHFEANTVRPRELNILITNIKKLYVDGNTQVVESSSKVEDTLSKLRANSRANNLNQIKAAKEGLTSKINNILKNRF